jgi:exopolysaccharide biosynthesis polyprenyl glycosylphosphotransferase
MTLAQADLAQPRAETQRVERLPSYVAVLVVIDAVAAVAAALATVLVRYEGHAAVLAGVDYRVLALLFVPLWVAVLALTGAYERPVVGVGSEEFRRVIGAAVRTLAAIAVVVAAFKVDVARSVIAVGLPSAAILTLVGRWVARQGLHMARRRGTWCHQVLVVGEPAACAALMNQLRRHPEAGLVVKGVCTNGPARGLGVPVVGRIEDVGALVQSLRVDTVAVAETASMGDEGLRRLAWSLEGHNVDLLVAPGLTFVAVPRIVVRPVDGSPLLHVAEADFSGPKRLVKTMADRVTAGVGLLLALFPLVILAVLVRLTSAGPAFFRQERVGRDGRTFRIWKLRTMVVGAASLPITGNDVDGLLFKLHHDPRVTRFGRFLRRWSLDELPQLFNVVTGSMSLVGPRPPLPTEVARYGDDVRRRLLVRPGLTGLWQVSGRSDLPWDEAVRLDLQYVENWSLALDVVILLRTGAAVLRRRGAY